MSEKLKGILEEMRDFADGQEKNNYYDLREMGTDSFRAYADRIEAAVVRENRTCKESLQVGNAAKLRLALECILGIVNVYRYEFIVKEVPPIIEAALKSKPRNCDKFLNIKDALRACEDELGSTIAIEFVKWLFAEVKGEAND